MILCCEGLDHIDRRKLLLSCFGERRKRRKMTQSVVSSAVKGLGDLLIQEAKFLYGVREQVEQMQTELKLMQSLLEDADKRQDEDKRVQTWVSEIREVAYDAEDVIETYALKIGSKSRGGIQNSFKRCACIINEAAELRKVGSKIEAIMTKISSLRASSQTYGIKPISEGEGSSSAHRTHGQWRRSYAHVVEEFTVGLDGGLEILVAQLVNVAVQNYGVVSICGMGGLGKTTLAKKVFHHGEIRRHFDGFSWAFISQQCQPREVWEGILFELISPNKKQRDEIKKLRYEEVAMKLYQVQQQRKCLVILYDIWTTETWNSLSPAFPVGKAGSKMLLTTRNKGVAVQVHPKGFLYEPPCLTDDEGWELLKKKAFLGKDDRDITHIDMEKLGRKMIGKCAGLPLAIIVLGGLLATKPTLNEWNMVHENINSYLRRGKGQEQQQLGGVSEVLALSYHELPYQLKPCFLYLCHFPEDFEIPTAKLIKIWVAEGIVSPMQYEAEGEETMEEIAERYLCELLDRCMVQVGIRGSTGRVKSCRLHDLMRDLCLSKANQENFLQIVQLQDSKKQVDFLSSAPRVHRLAIDLGEEYLNIFPLQERTLFLRSMLFFGNGDWGLGNSQKVQCRFGDLKLLKILDLEQCGPTKLGSAIGNLVHLRYLSLKSYAMNLPSSIGNLRGLQTLNLRRCGKMKIPNVIWKMKKLRHLYLPDNGMRREFLIRNTKMWGGKLQVSGLSYLQTLKGFDTGKCDVKGLSELANLKKLGINYVKSFKELVGALGSSNVTLNSLSLRTGGSAPNDCPIEETDLRRLFSDCPDLYKLYLSGVEIVKLPEYHHFPPNLTKLTLQWSELEEDPMPTLEKLPYLSILRLRERAFSGKKMVCSSKGFPQLKSLLLNGLHNLEEWCVREEAMPSLCQLVIEGCGKLKMVPDGLRFITTLRELQISMPRGFENRLRGANEGGGGEDLHKVQHVPSIILKSNYVWAVEFIPEKMIIRTT